TSLLPSSSGELFASHCYPQPSHDAFRLCTDFIRALLALDEVSDVQDSDGTREMIHLFVQALRNDPDCNDGSPLTKMLIGFRKIATPNCQRRFYQESVTYIQKEAEYHESGKVVDMEYYHEVRRGSSACFALFGPVLFGIDLPNEVVEHP
ncbi:hypothetical protein BJ322DRAFT_980721, partial [Thelephora terrestris]